MEESEKEAIREASEEVSHEFKSLINTKDLDSLKQLQLLMYILPIPLSEYSPVSRLYDIMFWNWDLNLWIIKSRRYVQRKWNDAFQLLLDFILANWDVMLIVLFALKVLIYP